MLDKHGCTLFCTICALDAGTHLFECRARFEIIWTEDIDEAEIASCTDDSISSNPEVREIESLKIQGNITTTCYDEESDVERAGGVLRQLNVNQLQRLEIIDTLVNVVRSQMCFYASGWSTCRKNLL